MVGMVAGSDTCWGQNGPNGDVKVMVSAWRGNEADSVRNEANKAHRVPYYRPGLGQDVLLQVRRRGIYCICKCTHYRSKNAANALDKKCA